MKKINMTSLTLPDFHSLLELSWSDFYSVFSLKLKNIFPPDQDNPDNETVWHNSICYHFQPTPLILHVHLMMKSKFVSWQSTYKKMYFTAS